MPPILLTGNSFSFWREMQGTQWKIALVALLLLQGCSGSGSTSDVDSTQPEQDSAVRRYSGDLTFSDLPPATDLSDFKADQAMPATCNGSAALCQRRYDQVAYGCTHNAMSSEEEGWWGPNQGYAVPRQLEDGIRAFMLDTTYFEDTAFLCHGPCQLGSLSLADGLARFDTFLEANPNNVVTIIFESYISASDTHVAFAESGLLARVYAHNAESAWPTLQEMISAGTNVVVFSDKGGGTYPWYHDVWDHAWETHWSNEVPEDFSCKPNRGSPDNDLFILNHFLTDLIASPDLATVVNHNPFLVDRTMQCWGESGQIPNFVTVDFYEIGDLFSTLESLNGAL